MHTQTLTRPDGTRSTYTAAPGSDLFLRLAALKPMKKPRSKADKRLFPAYRPGMSTAEYVRAYWRLNGLCGKPSQLFEPLNERAAEWYTGVDTVETIED